MDENEYAVFWMGFFVREWFKKNAVFVLWTPLLIEA